MHRRQFFQSLLAGVTAVLMRPWRRTGTYGYVDIDRAWRNGWLPGRVWCDGVEVSADCRAWDDERGYVVLMKRNEAGHHFVDWETGEVAQAVRHGVIEFAPNGSVRAGRGQRDWPPYPVTNGRWS